MTFIYIFLNVSAKMTDIKIARIQKQFSIQELEK